MLKIVQGMNASLSDCILKQGELKWYITDKIAIFFLIIPVLLLQTSAEAEVPAVMPYRIMTLWNPSSNVAISYRLVI